MKKTVFLALAVLSLGTIFCSVQTGGSATSTPGMGPAVDVTLTALAGAGVTPTVTPTSTPTSSLPGTGTITGGLIYPADAMPPERVVAWSTTDSSYYYVDVTGSSTYSLDVPAGTYTIVAYSIGGGGFPNGLPGGYTQAVLCTAPTGCDDHTQIPVTVTAGATVSDINPYDWYAPDGTFPPMP